MLKISNWLSRLNRVGLAPVLAPLTLGLALLTTVVPPVKALPVVQGGVYIRVGQPQPVYPSTVIYSSPIPSSYIYSSPTTSSAIYGSPIPSPVPLNQGTGLYNSQSPGYYNVNPVVPMPGQVVNAGIYDSVQINPALVNPRGYPSNSIGRSQVIYGYPGQTYGYPGQTYGYPGGSRIFIRR